MPPSRAKANHMRLMLVMDDRPHSHMATPMMTAIMWPNSTLSKLEYTMYSTAGEFAGSIVAGDGYVNVHTKRNPNGEIRGQM